MVHSAKHRGKTRSRILYWFRTPPSVRVGRAALDEDAIRLIEEHNPGVEFDWTRILKGQDTPEAKPKPEPERRQSRPQRQQREAPPAPKGPATPSAAAISPVPATVEIVPGTEEQLVPGTGEMVAADGVAGPPRRRDVEDEPEFPMVLSPDEPVSAALTRLGPEGLLRLRARHAEVLARISEKITDPVRRDELKSQAERLNPDTWVTDADVTAGLEQYETVFEALRSVVGRRRKRRKRRSGGGGEQPQAAAAPTSPDEAVTDDVGDEPEQE